MERYIKLSEAISAVEEEWESCCSEYDSQTIVHDTCEALEKAPTCYARPVVLCKNCKYAEKYDPFGANIICNNNKHTIVDYVSPDWFCADGVERDNGE